MTIALGILAPDGVVIAADTQESYGTGHAKVGSFKILSRVLRQQQCSFAATGAGWAGHLDALNQELADNFETITDRRRIEQRFQEKVLKFHNAHILPNHVLPREDQPSVALLVGLSSGNGKPGLFASELSAFYRCKYYGAAGVGADHAKLLLSRILPQKQHMTARLAALMAAFTVFHVKRHVEGCGIGTHVTVLQDGDGSYIPNEEIDRLESRFERYLEVDTSIVNHIVGYGSNEAIQHLGRDLRLCRLEPDKVKFVKLAGEAVRD